jgi:hypothetical protein
MRSKAEEQGNADVPETPSPKKKRVGGSGRSRYGKMAQDLSCPKPLLATKISEQMAYKRRENGTSLEG